VAISGDGGFLFTLQELATAVAEGLDLIALVFIAFSLLLGSAGYHYTEGLPWLDSTLNAAMILAGMGPVDTLRTNAGKIFATFYSLYSGIAFLTSFQIPSSSDSAIRLTLEFDLATGDGQVYAIRAVGEVRYCYQLFEEAKWRIGIQFKEIKEEDKARIANFVRAFGA